jgi:Ser/Thr protein kinase RdoA (MazF antagonist)
VTAELLACLPDHLRTPSTSFARIGKGLSSASVFRVEVGDARFALKLGASSVPLDTWRRAVEIHRLAAEAGLAPRVVHVDETRRAVLSEHAGDRGFFAQIAIPQTRDAAIERLGQVMRRLHALPIPSRAAVEPTAPFDVVWAALADFQLPTFARVAIERTRAEVPSRGERPLVLSHNDPNPSNLVFDGQRLLLLDWDGAGPNDPFYDLAALALFFRLDEPSTARLIAAHEATPVGLVPERFMQVRRLAAAQAALMAFDVVRRLGHPGGELQFDEVPALEGVYAALSAGRLSLSSREGLWAFALALARAIAR